MKQLLIVLIISISFTQEANIVFSVSNATYSSLETQFTTEITQKFSEQYGYTITPSFDKNSSHFHLNIDSQIDKNVFIFNVMLLTSGKFYPHDNEYIFHLLNTIPLSSQNTFDENLLNQTVHDVISQLKQSIDTHFENGILEL